VPKTTAWMYWFGQPMCCHGKAIAYLALQHTQSSLEDVHNGVVDAFPGIDNFVVVYARHQKDRSVVSASLGNALLFGILTIPALLRRRIFLRPGHQSQELDVSGREQVPAAIRVNDPLPWFGPLALYHARECALLFFDWLLGVV
jgi:hypothetical protein